MCEALGEGKERGRKAKEAGGGEKKAASAEEDSAGFSESCGRYKDVGEAAGRRSIRFDVKTI